METKTYSGYLSLKDYGDSDDVLWLSSLEYPFADELCDNISRKFVTVRYFITEKECTREKANECFVKQLYGEFDAEYQPIYTEITGYILTDEWIKVGGHDLLEELTSYLGKYLILEIDIHE